MHNESFFSNPRTWVAIAFLLFVVLSGRKLWAVLTGMLDARAATIRQELDEAARLRAEAEAMLRTAQSDREAALAEAGTLLANAKAEAARVTEQARVDAEAAGKRRERMATDRIAAAEKAAVTEVRSAAIDVATRAAAQVIAQGLSAQTDASLVDRAISALPQAMAKRVALSATRPGMRSCGRPAYRLPLRAPPARPGLRRSGVAGCGGGLAWPDVSGRPNRRHDARPGRPWRRAGC